MRLVPRHNFIRNIEATDYLEAFLVSAVASVMAIRLYLSITGYPQLGGSGFHIAHILWGGAFMLVAIFINLTFINRSAYYLAAILGGIGFGTFIDELGKFVTSDNNYFFRPAIALIYVVFILLYLYIQSLEKRRKITQTEYLINALEMAKEVVLKHLDKEEKTKIKKFLSKSDQADPLVKPLTDLIVKMDEIEIPVVDSLSRIKRTLDRTYEQLAGKGWFIKAVVTFFIVQSLVTIVQTFLLAAGITSIFQPKLFNFKLPTYDFVEMAELCSSIISGIFVIIGISKIKSSKLDTFVFFKRAILVSIFLTQFFAFYNDQLVATIALAFNIIILLALNYIIKHEQIRKRKEED